jgi:uncharacterized protein YndB with AHSA1/START domain
MKTLHFAVVIEAPREVVWDVMLGSDSYKTWTSAFAEGSYFEGSWNKGSQIRFLSPDGSGMTALIAENRPHEYLSIKHVGEVSKGENGTESERVRSWAPAFENYTFSPVAGGTEVKVAVDVTEEFEQFMLDTWPKALAKLKALCEPGPAAG